MPLEIYSFCSETNDLGDPHNCDLISGWHVNKIGLIDSGKGLPLGQKLQLKALPIIDNFNGDQIILEYKLIGLHANEKFRVGLNGMTLLA
mmetsp:Transcript_2699/g.4571  ORF Transcript_2699/g.4571 Transcript_2699/m.4571 type:complete len:90 (+) Transcript_2699:1452-1721(+)